MLSLTYQLHHADCFPCPGIRGEVSANDCTILSLNSGIQSAFAVNGPSGDNFDKVPLSFVGKSFCESLSSACFAWVELKRLLEALRGSRGIGWICKFGVVYAEGGVCRSICPVALQGVDEVGESFFTKVHCI